MRYFIIPAILISATFCYGQTDKYKLTEKDTLITCDLTGRSIISGPFADSHSADFEKLVAAVFTASKLPVPPYSIFKMNDSKHVRIGWHQYDELDYYTFFLYNLDSVMQFNLKAKSKYGLMAIIAHEAGHHIFNHHFNSADANIKNQELQADYFAGLTMASLNVPRSEGIKGLMAAVKNSGPGYPSIAERKSATLLGFDAGIKTPQFGPLSVLANKKKLSYDWAKKWSRIGTPGTEILPVTDGVFADSGNKFILDNKGQFIFQENNQNFVIARAIPSKDRTYKFMLFDNYTNHWWIDREGTITDSSGSVVMGKVDIVSIGLGQ